MDNTKSSFKSYNIDIRSENKSEGTMSSKIDEIYSQIKGNQASLDKLVNLCNSIYDKLDDFSGDKTRKNEYRDSITSINSKTIPSSKKKKSNNPIVWFELTDKDKSLGKIKFELFSNIVPRTCENFRSLCTGERGIGLRGKPLTYKGTSILQVFSDQQCVGGSIEGISNESNQREELPYDPYEIKHSGGGVISMLTEDNNQTGNMPDFNGKNVAFGKLIEGSNILNKINSQGSVQGNVYNTIKISDCGQEKGEE